MSQNGCNGEHVEVATRTAVAAAIVTSTAIYLIYKKKFVQYSSYRGSRIWPNFKRKCWKNKKFFLLFLFVIVICYMAFNMNKLPSVANLAAELPSVPRKQENIHAKIQHEEHDIYDHTMKHNLLYHPLPHPRHYGW